jgi:hypothetical protein
MYIQVGKSGFDSEMLKSQSLESLKKKFYRLPENVIEEAYYQVNPKPTKAELKAKAEKKKPKKKKSTNKD